MSHSLVPWLVFVTGIACAQTAGEAPRVRPGIEVLLEDSAHLVRGRRVGVLTNQTGIDRFGVSDVRRLLDADVEVTAILSPEHGYRGGLDQEEIGHGVDAATGIPVFSLYGADRRPTAAMLSRFDVLLIDLQDIGGRPYTYISTALEALRELVAHGLPVVVLDRPNPIGGTLVQGPVLDTVYRSFVGMLPVPQRHGLTLGELVQLGNDRLEIGADLTVVPAEGWTRDRWFDATGLPWVRPSPNMPDLESATHYPGLVLFEATNLSVGRGTARAFQVVGAPWLDARLVVRRLGPQAGVLIRDTMIQPVQPPDGKYGGRSIPAILLTAADRNVYDPVATAVRLLAVIRGLHTDSLTVDESRLARLVGTASVGNALREGGDITRLLAGWRRESARFERERRRYLLYP